MKLQKDIIPSSLILTFFIWFLRNKRDFFLENQIWELLYEDLFPKCSNSVPLLSYDFHILSFYQVKIKKYKQFSSSLNKTFAKSQNCQQRKIRSLQFRRVTLNKSHLVVFSISYHYVEFVWH